MEVTFRDADGDLLVITSKGGDVYIATERVDGNRSRAIATKFSVLRADVVLAAFALAVRWAKLDNDDD